MSKHDEKIKHSKRRHNTETFIKKQTKIAKSSGIKNLQPHRFAKRHAMDCGRPNCGLCGNPRKIHNEKTIQEKKWEQSFDDE